MKIGLAQIDAHLGDLEGNVERCLAAIDRARSLGADLVVLPELTLPGGPPRDMLLDSSFVESLGAAADDLAWRARSGPPVIVGSAVPAAVPAAPGHPGLLDAALLLEGGTRRVVAAKRHLPCRDVSFDPRWFVPGGAAAPVVIAGVAVGVLVNEDLEDAEHAAYPPGALRDAGAELLVVIAASHYRKGVLERRLRHARRAGCPVAFVNATGAVDELVFDGRSFVLDGRGEELARLAAFADAVRVVDLEAPAGPRTADPPLEEELFRALVLGVREFARKNRIGHAFVGVSGGVDSALVAVIAAEALGPEHVTAIAIPSRYTDPRSTSSARELAAGLGIGFEVVDLEPLHAAAETGLAGVIDGGTTAENVQARLRMVVLMAFVNSRGGMLLNTSNKTELTLGYSTLYGDTAGTLCPIADLTKPEVYALARWIAGRRAVIPPFILERPPSAELRPGQVDPFDYDVVAPAVDTLVQHDRSDVAMRRSEHKRRQFGVVLKVSERSFGSGRLVPITRR